MADLRGDGRGITDFGESDPLFLWNHASDVVRRFHDGGDYPLDALRRSFVLSRRQSWYCKDSSFRFMEDLASQQKAPRLSEALSRTFLRR